MTRVAKPRQAGTFNRRWVLTAGASVGVAAIALRTRRSSAASIDPGAGLTVPGQAAGGTRELLTQPSEIRSINGILATSLTAAPATVQLGDFRFPGFVYNGSYIPPLLRVRLGDTMRINFKNGLPNDPSNLHYHGMSVSPRGNSDNVFLHLHPGQQFEYEVRIPAAGRQGPGLFWYHPHAHGVVEKQILGGLSGALVVDGSDQLYPFLMGLPERFFLFKHAEIGGDDNQVISINGQVDPIVQIRPGEMQFWRIANIGATLFIKFRIAGMPLYVVATDGHPLSRPRKMTEFFLGPGERIDVIAIGPGAGEYAMNTIPFQNEAWRKPEPSRRMATILASGPAASAADAANGILQQRLNGAAWIDEVRSAPIAQRRTLVYSRTADRQDLHDQRARHGRGPRR